MFLYLACYSSYRFFVCRIDGHHFYQSIVFLRNGLVILHALLNVLVDLAVSLLVLILLLGFDPLLDELAEVGHLWGRRLYLCVDRSDFFDHRILGIWELWLLDGALLRLLVNRLFWDSRILLVRDLLFKAFPYRAFLLRAFLLGTFLLRAFLFTFVLFFDIHQSLFQCQFLFHFIELLATLVSQFDYFLLVKEILKTSFCPSADFTAVNHWSKGHDDQDRDVD